MQRKHFVAYAVMDSENLRANFGYHSCLIFLYADCDDNGNLTSPLYLDEKRRSYSFYSHPLPEKKKFSEEPITFFTQILPSNFRQSGSYGEYKEEHLHDLTYGRGLTGKIFERSESKIDGIKAELDKALAAQKAFLSQADNDLEREKLYSKFPKDKRPIPEFNAFPLFGGQHSCKVATLNPIANSYDKNNPDDKIVLDYIYYLRYGPKIDNRLFTYDRFYRFLTSFIPRMTPDLEELIFHCASDRWESRGEGSKYPYCEWDNVKEREIFAVSAGGYYIDQKGLVQPLLTLSKDSRQVVLNLKAISRICEVNIADKVFEEWHKIISELLLKIARANNPNAQHAFSVHANENLRKLITSEKFKAVTTGMLAKNLQSLLDDVHQHYKPPVVEIEQEETDEVNRTWVLA